MIRDGREHERRTNVGRTGIAVVVVVHVFVAVTVATLAGAAGATLDLDEVRALAQAGQRERAAAEGRALLTEIERSDPGSLDAAEVAVFVVRIMTSPPALGAKQERLELAERALEIRKRRLDDDDPLLAEAYYMVGLVHNLTGHAGDALLPFQQALAIAESHYGSNAPELEEYVREVGTALYVESRHEEARDVFARLDVLCRDKYGVGHPGTIRAVFNLALVNQTLGDFEEAKSFYRQALEILEQQNEPDLGTLAWTRKGYAGLLASEGRLQEALDLDERVLVLRRQIHGPDSAEVAGTLNDLGFVLRSLGDFEKARNYLEDCLRIQGLVKVNPSLALKSRVNLAAVLRDLGEDDAARAMFEQARKVGLEEFSDDHSYWGTFHREFGDYWLAKRGTPQAREQYAKSLGVLTATVGDDHYELGLVMSGLGRADLALGNLEEARQRLERSVTILDSKVGSTHPNYATALDSLSVFYYAADSSENAFNAAVKAERVHRDLVRSTLTALPERQALAQASRPWHGRDVAVTVALESGATAGQRRDAFDSVIRSRAVVFDEIAARQRLYRSAPNPEIRKLATHLESARERVAHLFVLGPAGDPGGYADRMASAQNEVELRESELARSSETYRADFAVRDFGYADLARHLPKGTASVSFVRYLRYRRGTEAAVPSYAAIVQGAGSTGPRFVDLGSAEVLESAIASWRESLSPSKTEERYRRVAAGLREVLWDPLAPVVKDAATLYVIPEGAVHLVSFASLPVDKILYLLERGPTLHYLTAERDLVGYRSAEEGSGLLALGDPSFNRRGPQADSANAGKSFRGSTANCAGLGTRGFPQLPAAREEAAIVKRIWESRGDGESAMMLVGGDATEGALKRNAPGRSVLHLATHGFFLGEDCGPSPLSTRGIGGLSTAGDDTITLRSAGATVNPLLLSGLVLAGANRRDDPGKSDDDGILTAEEVTALDLRGVQLAVLSACQTGAGTIQQGEGVFGLRRAFLIAGARVVVTNLWDVDDLVAQEWIEHMYEQKFLRGRSTADAMRGASLAVLRARRSAELSTHPSYWAGWVAVGDPSS